MTAQAFNKKLHEMGVQHKIGGTWVLYERYKGEGFVHSKTTEYTKSDKDVYKRQKYALTGGK